MKYVNILHSLFNEGFMDAYRAANPRRRRRILPYLQAVHRRWYYATLVENTPFSPANLMEGICRHFGEEPSLCPIPVLRTPAKVAGVDTNVLSYTIDAHPIVNDMRRIIEYCTPHVDLCEAECFTDAQALEAAELLSLNDPHYASFLLELAIWMKLLTKMPSLYIHRMQLSKKCAETLQSGELLRDIVDAAISMTANGIRNSVPMPEQIFSESFIRSLLAKPMETDEIFARVFEVMGYDMEDLLDINNMPLDSGIPLESLGYDMELLSGTFVMGIVLDRFFFTPFGHFLRLIRPMYALPFSFADEVSDYINVSDDPDEAFVAFFAPCSSYTLTELGLELFGAAPSDENFFDASELPFENMKDTIFVDETTLATFIEMARHLSPLVLSGGLPGQIYTLRVRLEDNPSVWMHLQIPENVALNHLYEEVAKYFQLKHNDEYSFFHDKFENRFAEIPSAKRAGRAKNPRKSADDILLSEIDFEHLNQLLLAAYNQSTPFAGTPSTVRLQLERLSEKPPEPEEFYPRAGRMSKDMKRRLPF